MAYYRSEYEADVLLIPAAEKPTYAGGRLKSKNKLRVAAYCRVSTGDQSQQTSYTKQKAYYEEFISRRDNWTLAGIFADEGISGTSTKGRKEFMRMMDAALSGGMDYIVTKSISRFARNTVDTLSCVRRLRGMEPPVGVFFEKENIDTLDAKGELILTILSALAQEESRSISDNIKWSIRKNFENGVAHLSPNRILGYKKGLNRDWVIEEEQAEIIRFIFDNYVGGKSATKIADMLNENNVLTGKGGMWRADAVLYILRNEKYVGDCEMQKYVTENYLTHKSVVNTGQAPKIYITNHHPGIIDRNTWERARRRLELRKKRTDSRKKYSEKQECTFSVFENLRCGDCGGRFIETVYRAKAVEKNTEFYYSYVVGKCESRMKGVEAGKEEHNGIIYEVTVQQCFMELLYRLKRDYERNGNNSEIVKRFADVLKRELKRNTKYLYSFEQSKIIKEEIKFLSEKRLEIIENRASSQDVQCYFAVPEHEGFYEEREADAWDSDLMDLERAIKEKQIRLKELEYRNRRITSLRKNFELFIGCLEDLPDTNPAGMRLNVNTIDRMGTDLVTIDGVSTGKRKCGINSGRFAAKSERIAKAPDFLIFEPRVYMAFVESGVIHDDVITFKTVFGAELSASYVKRRPRAYMGYRKCCENGKVECVTKRHQAIALPQNDLEKE